MEAQRKAQPDQPNGLLSAGATDYASLYSYWQTSI